MKNLCRFIVLLILCFSCKKEEINIPITEEYSVVKALFDNKPVSPLKITLKSETKGNVVLLKVKFIPNEEFTRTAVLKENKLFIEGFLQGKKEGNFISVVLISPANSLIQLEAIKK